MRLALAQPLVQNSVPAFRCGSVSGICVFQLSEVTHPCQDSACDLRVFDLQRLSGGVSQRLCRELAKP